MPGTIEPYKHDCKNCEWVGWYPHSKPYGNVYICRNGKDETLIIRYSDEPSDYWSMPLGISRRGPVQVHHDPL